MWAEPDLPAILSLVMVKGNYNTFNDPTTTLISASVAKALFGNADPLGQLIKVDNKSSLKVAGVYEDLPHNTTLSETMFMMPWKDPSNWWNTQSDRWDNHGTHLYVQLNNQAYFGSISAKIRDRVPVEVILGCRLASSPSALSREVAESAWPEIRQIVPPSKRTVRCRSQTLRVARTSKSVRIERHPISPR